MGQDHDEIIQKLTAGLKKPELSLNLNTAANFRSPNSEHLRHLLGNMAREKEEQVQREKETVEVLRNLYELAKDNPTQLQQHIQTLVQNSGTIQNMQNVHSGSTGIQNIMNNTGIQAEDLLKLLDGMRDLSEVLQPQKAEEALDVIDDLKNEIQQPEPKKGRIKASLTYLKSLFSEILVDPAKGIVKAQFTGYVKEKAPEIIEGIDKLFDVLGETIL